MNNQFESKLPFLKNNERLSVWNELKNKQKREPSHRRIVCNNLVETLKQNTEQKEVNRMLYKEERVNSHHIREKEFWLRSL